MSTTPAPEREGKQKSTGTRLLVIGLAVIAIGVVILLALSGSDSGTPKGIGVAFISLGSLPTIAGLVLIGSAAISGRSRKGKPFA